WAGMAGRRRSTRCSRARWITVMRELGKRGHDAEIIGAYDETIGHAGMIIRNADTTLEGAAGPRSEGAVTGLLNRNHSASATALPRSAVPALPPRSGVFGPSRSAVSIALTTAA